MLKILWATPTTLLDTSNGESLMVLECLKQLAIRGCEISILGATVFVDREGMSARAELWTKLHEHVGKFVNIKDGYLTHRLLVTKNPKRRLMHSYEEENWFEEYGRAIQIHRPDVVLFYRKSLISLLVASEARRRGISVGIFLMHGNNYGNGWCRDINWMFTDTNATADLYKNREKYPMIPIGTFVNIDKVKANRKINKSLLFVNPVPEKGVILVIQTALHLSKYRPDIILEVVDSRKTWNTMIKQVDDSLGLTNTKFDNVIVTPHTIDMRPVYERAHLLLVPSIWWESGPRVIVEALSNGIPVLGSNSGGIAEVLGNGGEIITITDEYRKAPYTKLFSEEIVETFVNMICKFWDDESYYQKKSRDALDSHNHLHNLKKNGDSFFSTIKNLLKN